MSDKMSELSKFKVSEEFKDYFYKMNQPTGKFKLSKKSIDEAGPLVAETHQHFQEIRKESDDLAAVKYLWDVCGYYIALCAEYRNHNDELIELLKEFYK